MTPEIKKNPAIAKRVEEIALALGQVRSVVDTPGEIDAANKVYEIFSQMDYWKEHPEERAAPPFWKAKRATPRRPSS